MILTKFLIKDAEEETMKEDKTENKKKGLHKSKKLMMVTNKREEEEIADQKPQVTQLLDKSLPMRQQNNLLLNPKKDRKSTRLNSSHSSVSRMPSSA